MKRGFWAVIAAIIVLLVLTALISGSVAVLLWLLLPVAALLLSFLADLSAVALKIPNRQPRIDESQEEHAEHYREYDPVDPVDEPRYPIP